MRVKKPVTSIPRTFIPGRLVGLAAALSLALLTAPLGAVTVDYETLSIDPSQVVDDEYDSSPFLNLTISGVNTGGGPDLVAVYDTRGGSPGNRDPDLESPWVDGNAMNVPTGNVLIIQENGGESGGFLTDDPDDEAGGGIITFSWDRALINSIAWYAPDGEVENETESLVRFYVGNTLLTELSYLDLQVRDPTIVWGDSTLNYIQPFTAAEIGGQWDRVEWEFIGSGALGVVIYDGIETPEPSTFVLTAAGLIGLIWRRRRKML